MYAIIETDDKQYKVSEGDIIKVEKLGQLEGEYVFNNVCALSSEAGFKAGAPYIEGASVSATVLGEGKAKKVIIYKYKAKKGFHKKKGHRQPFTALKINSINA